MNSKFYITTSIMYANGPAHLGFALELIQADVLARNHRPKGDNTFFLTGTDEHGSTVVRAAAKNNSDPKNFVDNIVAQVKDLIKKLNISNDNFIRTSDQQIHWPVAQELWQCLGKAGDLYKKTYQGLYCVGHEAFVTQKDLVNGKCRDHKKEPEALEEENWFFRLSKYSAEIESRIKNNELRIVPEGRKNEVLSLLKEGLEDISFSRPSKDLSWGVPVPGDSTQTMYVWADALSNYISGYGLGDQNGLVAWEEHPADVHVIGKDILRFHAAIWPGMLLSAGLKLPKSIFVHGHILVGGEKMSKTVGNVVDPFELVQKYGTDPVRYYLLREIPSGEDGDFSVEKFEERYNGDLANGLGNFAARVLTLASDAKLSIDANDVNVEKVVEEKIKETKESVFKKIEEFKLNEALEAIWELIHFGDRYVNEKKPWGKQLTIDQRQLTIFNLIAVLDNVAALLAPFLPETAEKITQSIRWGNGVLKIEKSEALFPRL